MMKRQTARKTTKGPLSLSVDQFMTDDSSDQEEIRNQNEISDGEQNSSTHSNQSNEIIQLESSSDQDDLTLMGSIMQSEWDETSQESEITLFDQEVQNNSSQSSEFVVSIDTSNSHSNLNSNQIVQQQTTTSNYINRQILRPPTQPINLDDQLSPAKETGWISYGHTVHAFKFKFKIGVTDRAKIAAFDLDGTLITPKSNKKFSRDMNDWKILDDRLKSKISKLIDDGYAFVIFSNQMGVSMKFVTLEQIKYKFRNIIQSINLPCVALFCTDLDKYRKPSIGMFEFYKMINRTKIDLQDSFFVGDAMGRPKDHSAADLLFAYNCKLPFISIEGFLSEFEKPKLFTYDQLKEYRIPKFSSANSNNQILPRIIAKGTVTGEISEFCFIEELTRSIESFVENNFKSIVILLIGLFGSGKTFFFDKYLANLNYKSIDYDLKREWQDEEALFNSFVNDDKILNKRIVIDQPNLNYNQRKRWIDLAKKEGYEVFAIHFNLPVDHCLHLIRFRSFYFEPDRRIPSQNEMMKQSLSFQKPGYDEGFKTIYVLDFLEDFNDSLSKENQQYYYHFLYDRP